jgi:protein TonB
MTNPVIDPTMEKPRRVVVVKPLVLLQQEQPSLLVSLKNSIRDVLFPEKLPPLKLTSRPVAVRSIWEQHDRKRSTGISLAIHIALVALIIGLTLTGAKVVTERKHDTITYIPTENVELPITKKAGPTMGGGGGGGAHEKIQAPKGKLPKVDMQQITPPAIVVKNEHPKLEVEPSVMSPVKPPVANNMPTLGDAMAKVAGPASNGTGAGGGIGAGSGGGVGIGTGRGIGQGSGMGYGGGVFKVGGGVLAPKVLEQPDPEYSEEARKAKFQGEVVLWLIVGADGRPRDIRVQRGVGMGLDQKAMEAVQRWKFEPATKDGKPVAVQISVEVNFRLY